VPRITALEKQIRRPGRVSVFVDGSFAVGLSAEAARELGLEVGRDLGEDELRALALAHEADRAYERATRYLRARPRSRAEIERRLERYGYGDDVIRHVLARLRERGFVDDRAFAGAWVRDRALAPRLTAMRAKAEGKGRAAALSFLARRGFDAALARRLAQEVFSS
jgi:regulatory protein